MLVPSDTLDHPNHSASLGIDHYRKLPFFFRSFRFRDAKALIWAVLLLNLLDAGLTWIWVDLKIAEEANWLLRSLVEYHPAAFVAVKMAVVCIALAFIWKHHHNRLAIPGLILAFSVYSLLLVYHLQIAMWSLHLWLPMNFPALISG